MPKQLNSAAIRQRADVIVDVMRGGKPPDGLDDDPALQTAALTLLKHEGRIRYDFKYECNRLVNEPLASPVVAATQATRRGGIRRRSAG